MKDSIIPRITKWTTTLIILVSCMMYSFAQEGPINLTKVGFTKKVIETSQGEMAVFEAGEGEPMLLLHGVGAGASSFLWFSLAPELAKRYRVIAPDFIGWGESYHPNKDLLFDDYVQQIREVSSYIGEPANVIASSLTAGFALSTIKDGGLNVKKIALFTPSGGFDFGVDAFGEQMTETFQTIALSPQREQFYVQGFHAKPAVENWWRNEGFLDGKNVPTEIIESNHYNAKLPNASYSALPFLSGTLRYDIAPLLKDLEVPAMMVWGQGEFRIKPDVRKKIAEINSSIPSYEVENARTAFAIEQPEATLELLTNFFKY